MIDGSRGRNRRILIVDDNVEIHKDFRKILADNSNSSNLNEFSTALFGKDRAPDVKERYEIDAALQGREGVAKVVDALKADQPYSLAFVDMRMPPGWDGIETIRHLWREDPALHVVICTAYSDYSWFDIVHQLPERRDQLLILKKPFHSAEVCQMAAALTEKHYLAKQTQVKMDELNDMVKERTRSLLEANGRLHQEQAEREQQDLAAEDSPPSAAVQRGAPIQWFSGAMRRTREIVEHWRR